MPTEIETQDSSGGAPAERRAEIRERALAHYQEQAALANLPAAVEELKAARNMLRVLYPSDLVLCHINEALRLLQAAAPPREDADLVWERLPSGEPCLLRSES